MSVDTVQLGGADGVGAEMATIETMPALRRYIRAMLAEGESMRAALLAYRGAGGAIRTEDFATLWRDERRKRIGADA